MEDIESDLRFAEVKRRKLCKTFEQLHSLASSELKDLQNHLESTEILLETLFDRLRERESEIALKEKKLEEKELLLNNELEEIEVKKQEAEALQLLIETKCEELEVKEKEYDAILISIEGKIRERKSVEESVSEAVKKLHSLENTLRKKSKEAESKISEGLKEVEMKRLLENRCRELELKERQLERRVNELESRRIEFESLPLCSELKIKQFDHTQNSPVRCQSSIADESKHLWLLNQHLKSHDLVCSAILSVFGNSQDPARLVLDAIRDIFCLPSNGKHAMSDASFVQRSCVLLPMLLREASPQINPRVREDATALAGQWKARMTVTHENSLEVLGFSQFLASYRLASAFDPNDLSNLLDALGFKVRSSQLCPAICTVDKSKDSIQNLIRRVEIIHAVRHIYTYKQTDKFSPIPLLIECFFDAENYTTLCSKGNNSNVAKKKVEGKEISALRAVKECIKDYNLESEFPSDKILKRVAVLEKNDKLRILESERSRKRRNISSPLPGKDQPPQEGKTKSPRLTKGSDTHTRTKPVEGPVKLNFGFTGREVCGFISVVARDKKGTVFAIWCRRVSKSNPLLGEALAASGALSMASSSGWDTISLEGSSEQVISYLKRTSTPTTSLDRVIPVALLESFRSANPVLVTREENAMAYNVSQWAARNNVQDGLSWISVPSSLFYIFG